MKKIISCLIAGIISLSAVSAFAFTDTEISEYKSEITELTSLGIINGFEDGTFKPDNKVTRAEAAKMFAFMRNYNNLYNSVSTADKEFSDLPQTHWAYPYIYYANSKFTLFNLEDDKSECVRIIDGYEDGTFRPDNHITIAEILKMAVTAFNNIRYYNEAIDNGGYPEGFVQTAVKYGFANGIDISNINAEATRGQTARIISNVIDVPITINLPLNSIKDHCIEYKSITVNLDGTNKHFPRTTFKSMLESDIWSLDELSRTTLSPLEDSDEFYACAMIENISGNEVTAKLSANKLINTDGSTYEYEEEYFKALNNDFILQTGEGNYYYLKFKKQGDTWVIDDYARI